MKALLFTVTILFISIQVSSAYAISVGDVIVRNAFCRSGSPFDDYNSAPVGHDMGQVTGIPGVVVVPMTSSTESYKNLRRPCPFGDTLEVHFVEVESLKCAINGDVSIQGLDAVRDLDLTKNISGLGADRETAGVRMTGDLLKQAQLPCPADDWLLIVLKAIPSKR